MPPQAVGHYTIEDELGHGQNGAVYPARDMRLDRRVAIKVLSRIDEDAGAQIPTKYHCPDSPWYGRTLTGRYLMQKEAQRAGYAPAYGEVYQ